MRASVQPALLAIAAVALSTGALPAQSSASDGTGVSASEVAASDFPYTAIVENGRARPCRALADDPLNKVRVGTDADPHTGMLRPEFVTIVPDEKGGYVSAANEEQITGPEFWQRTGVGIDQYAFRAPSTGEPLCIGSRNEGDRFPSYRRFDPADVDRFAGFRRIVDAAPYRGHRLRFTAWVATGSAEQVSFWLAAGTAWSAKPLRSASPPPNLLLNGGNTNRLPFGGNHDWTPVVLETGPIHTDADHVSYGINLQGRGDVWVFEPTLEIVADQPGDARTDDLTVTIGRDRL